MKNGGMKKTGDHPLLNKMIFCLFVFGVIMTISLTCLRMYLTYTHEVKSLTHYLENIENSQLQVLANNVWKFNEETIAIQLDSIVQQNDIVYVELNTLNDQYHAGVKPADDSKLLSKKFKLHFNFRGEEIPIADFVIYATTDNIKNHLIQQLPGIIAVEFIKVVIVCAFALFLFYFYFNRHLLQITEFTKNIDFHNLGEPLLLSDKKQHPDNPDELDRIVSALNEMSQRLQDDIALKEKLEEELRQSQKMEAIGTLAGGIAHDFNNILAAIYGYTELATLHLDNKEKLQQDLERVRQAAERAKSLIQQILTFSRKSGQNKYPMKMSLIVEEAVKLVRSSLPSTIEIKKQITAEEQTVLADSTQIHQIILNLCTNAHHAMLETGGTISVTLHQREVSANDHVLGEALPVGTYLELEVSDDGTGMDEATKEKIFEPYFTTKTTGAGTGLGLAMVHGIVREHDGIIQVYSELGRGTIFRLYFPVIDSPPAAEVPEVEPVLVESGGQHILFVDDEETILSVAREAFPVFGYKITTFSHPEEALSAFQENPELFDLLITDMTMPQMTGVELAKKIMACDAQLPIILCSGYSTLIDRDSAREIGIREYVSKPVTAAKLVKIIRKVLAENRAKK